MTYKVDGSFEINPSILCWYITYMKSRREKIGLSANFLDTLTIAIAIAKLFGFFFFFFFFLFPLLYIIAYGINARYNFCVILNW